MEKVQFINNDSKNIFYNYIVDSIRECNSFHFSVAFISTGAVQLLVDSFTDAAKRGIKGRILTTDYMFGTDPKALRRLLKFSNIEVRIFKTLDKNIRGFHTKGYIFDKKDNIEVSVGSSNLTTNALKNNHEWNLAYYSKNNDNLIEKVYSEFELLWESEDVIIVDEAYLNDYENAYYSNKYSKVNQQELFKQLAEFLRDHADITLINEIADKFEIEPTEFNDFLEDTIKEKDIKPNLMQENALESLANLRKLGIKKGLVIAATGTGKTYLAAFDALQYSPKKLLFIVHREKILKDAMRTFRSILNIKTGLYTGNNKDLNADYMFASIQTISKNKNLYQMPEDTFDYIVIDEAHRSAAPTYKKVMNHFKPKFMLGLTATPERTDSNNIFELFDNQIAAEIRLRDALKENLVVPFHYYGITDAVTDYDGIDVTKDIDEVAERLNIKERVDLIIENIEKYDVSGKKIKAIGFCANIKHAKYMSEQFNSRGLKSVALTSENTEDEREFYIQQLEDEKNDLSYVFAVDILNEGIDIPSLNLVLLLRPTQSPIIFTQQLGRGLRLHAQKEFLTVLDFIGEHNKTFFIPIALSGNQTYDKDDVILETKSDFLSIPGDTFIRLDAISKNQILSQLETYNFDEMKNLKELYMQTKSRVKTIPDLLDFGFDGFDPIRFIDKSSTYIEFVSRNENIDAINEIIENKDLIKYFRFIDSLLPIKRIHEYAVLEYLIDNNRASLMELINHTLLYINDYEMEDFTHAIDHLSGKLFVAPDDKRFKAMIIYDGHGIRLTDELMTQLSKPTFKKFMINSIKYGIKRYQHDFGRNFGKHPHFLHLYPYTVKDVVQVGRFKKMMNIREGIASNGNNIYLFVNLLKGDVKESINYKDEFLDRRTFQWESQNKTTKDGKTGQELIKHKEMGINIHLFVKKGGKKTDLYTNKLIYLGTVDATDPVGEKPIKFKLRLHKEVPEDVYYRLTTEYKNGKETN